MTNHARARGIKWALVAAAISGVAVFLNGYGVRAAGDATVYTTAKNLIAALVLIVAAVVTARPAAEGARPGGELRHILRLPRAQLAGLAAIGVIGGSVPFVLFFEGLARASSANAAFVQKTLVVWVAVLAVPLLRERLGLAHVGAIALLIVGQAVAAGGFGGFGFGSAQWLILAATLLWAVEVIIAKRLLSSLQPLTVGVARMVIGSVLLVGWVITSGRLADFTALSGAAWGWIIVTGVILAGYVGTWLRALALAPAVDVTAVLVAGAIITAALSAAKASTSLPGYELLGLGMLALGTVVIAAAPRLSRVQASAP